MTLANIIDKLEGKIIVTDDSDNIMYHGYAEFAAEHISENVMGWEIGAIKATENGIEIWLYNE